MSSAQNIPPRGAKGGRGRGYLSNSSKKPGRAPGPEIPVPRVLETLPSGTSPFIRSQILRMEHPMPLLPGLRPKQPPAAKPKSNRGYIYSNSNGKYIYVFRYKNYIPSQGSEHRTDSRATVDDALVKGPTPAWLLLMCVCVMYGIRWRNEIRKKQDIFHVVSSHANS